MSRQSKTDLLSKDSYTWDLRGNITQIIRSQPDNPQTIQKNYYSANQLRYKKWHLKKEIIPSTKPNTPAQEITKSETIYYTYDKADKLITEEQNNQKMEYLYFGSERIAKIKLGQDKGQDLLFWYLNDPLGTPILTYHPQITWQDFSNNKRNYSYSQLDSGCE